MRESVTDGVGAGRSKCGSVALPARVSARPAAARYPDHRLPPLPLPGSLRADSGRCAGLQAEAFDSGPACSERLSRALL